MVAQDIHAVGTVADTFSVFAAVTAIAPVAVIQPLCRRVWQANSGIRHQQWPAFGNCFVWPAIPSAAPPSSSMTKPCQSASCRRSVDCRASCLARRRRGERSILRTGCVYVCVYLLYVQDCRSLSTMCVAEEYIMAALNCKSPRPCAMLPVEGDGRVSMACPSCGLLRRFFH
jgi:hypothetical protein